MKAELKTKATGRSVGAFLGGIENPERRRDCRTVLQILKAATKAQPTMWGAGIVGFGTYRYKYASGREGDWFQAGFSPRKDSLTLYLMSGLQGQEALLKRLGRHKTGKGCLYIKRLADVDVAVLKKLVAATVKQVRG